MMARLARRAAAAARRALTVPGVLLAVAGAGVLGTPAIAQAAAGAPASATVTAQHAAVARPDAAAQTARAAGAARTGVAAGTAHIATVTRPAAPSGICSVPGIGDIGGLVGLCNAGSSGLIGDLNNICQPSVPTPETASGGIDALIRPPSSGAKPASTLYNSYGMAGQTWAAYGLQCSDMTSLIGNSVAGMVFDAAKALDRVTITVYQSAAGEGILSWLTGAVDRLITGLGNAIYFPYLAPVVILGAIWLAWQGLIRKRATRTIEGTIWMVVACAAAIWLIGRPADFTGLGRTVSNGITQTLNVAFAGLPSPPQSDCVPVTGHDPQAKTASFSYTGGSSIVDQNANQLWSVLVCKPWLDGEFGTTVYTTGQGAKPTVVNTYGRQLLWAQAFATNETPSSSLITAKQDAYAGIAASLKQNQPGVYSLFQGNQYPTRLEIAFAALFAALVAGVLVLLIAITLIILKLGFLLLLVAGPFFLIIGTHPGFGRVVALRWLEMLVGVLLKQAAIALVLSVLLYAYSLIMGTSDAALPWALKILMIALVTVAVFIYRKPFVHLFSAVGYGMVGSRDRGEAELVRAGSAARRNTVDAATVGVPGFAAYRAGRWARRNPGQAAGLAAQVAVAGGAGAVAGAAAGAASRGAGTDTDTGTAPEQGTAAAEAGEDGYQSGTGRGGGPAARGRGRATAGLEGSPRAAPPLDLPDRDGTAQRPASGWSRAAGGDTAAGRAPGAAAPGTARAAGAPPAAGAGAAPGPAGGVAGGGPAAAPPRPQQASSRQRWPGAAPRQPAAPRPSGSAPRPSGGGARPPAAAVPGQSPGAAPPWFGAGPSRGAPSRAPSPAREAGPAASSGPVRSGAGPARGSGPFAAGGAPARSASPGRGPERSAPPRARAAEPGAARPAASRPASAPPASAPPASAPAGGTAAGGAPSAGQAGAGRGAGNGPAVPFWLRPVRRRK
jgi:hypothetical protein